MKEYYRFFMLRKDCGEMIVICRVLLNLVLEYFIVWFGIFIFILVIKL